MHTHAAHFGSAHHPHRHRARRRFKGVRVSTLIPDTMNPANWVHLWKTYRLARRLGYDPFTAWRAAKKC